MGMQLAKRQCDPALPFGVPMKITRSRVLVLSALALASAQAFADGPSVYALIDGGIAASKVDGASKTEFVTGGQVPTFVGFKLDKTEGGITYGVQLEQGFVLSTPSGSSGSLYFFGNGDLLNRQKNIFVSSTAGKFVFGVQPNIAFGTALMADPRGAANYGSSLTTINGLGDYNGALNTVDNASLSYTSPTFSGFTVSAQLVPESSSKAGDIKTGNRTAFSYASGNLTLGLSTYSSQMNNTAAGATVKDSSGTLIGATYKMGSFTLKGISASQKTDKLTSDLTTNGIGGSYSLNEKISFDLGFYSASSNVGKLKLDTTAVGGYYSLAKDLKVYAQYAIVENKGDVSSWWNFAPPTVADGTVAAGKKADVLNVGLIFSYF